MAEVKTAKRSDLMARRYQKYGRILEEMKVMNEKRNISDIVSEMAGLYEIGESTVWSIWRGDYL